MPRESKLSDAFAQAIELALEHYADPVWLGSESPLAAPYFLGNYLNDSLQPDTPAGRGNVLRTLLRENARRLPAEQQQVLSASYFERKPNLNNIGVALQLGMAEKTYYRHQKAAIEALAASVNEHVTPPIRTELPRARPLAGRGAMLAQIVARLGERETVAITGAAGIGKTALGATLAHQWPAGRAFWFTVRPGLTDQLSSLCFALGFFLHRLGASNTWRQLAVDRGALNAPHILALLRNDLRAVPDPPVLLCLDEVHLLRPELDSHARIIHVLEDLRDLAPVLLLGQHCPLQAGHYTALTGLTSGELDQLLEHETLSGMAADERESLRRATRGNPALIRLCLVLRRAGEPLHEAIAQLANAPSVETLFQRIWKGLDEEARGMLLALSVFRSAAPRDAWPRQQAALDALIARDVAQADDQGGVALLPFLRDIASQRVTAEAKAGLHLAAARIREARSEYTPAAYHYIAARQPALAVWVWFNHRQVEIAHGHGPAASALFEEVAPAELGDDDDRRALALLRAELLKLTGAAEEALGVLDRVAWPEAHPATPYARQVRGDFQELSGQMELALASYRDALRGYAGAPERQIVQLHTRVGYVHLIRMRDTGQARQDATWALWRAETFMGNVEEETGNYPAASARYQAAQALALQVEDTEEAQSLTFEHLGRLAWRQGDARTAITSLEQAIAHARARGDSLGVVYNQITLSAALIEDGQYETALAQAYAGLSVAESLRQGYLISGLAVNAGDACLYLGRPGEAEQYAQRILREEEAIFRPHALQLLGRACHAQGRWAGAETHLHDAIRAAQETQDRGIESFVWKMLGRVYADQDKRLDALAAFRQAQRMYADLGLGQSREAVEIEASITALEPSPYPGGQRTDPLL